tara:strand:- start:4436 stop:5026 length:591 start_codon:yes stop_codon:yes gene_type:complete
MLSSKYKKNIGSLVYPIAKFLIRLHLRPNHLTLLGFISSIGVMLFLANGNLILAFISLLLCGFFDLIDGAVARVSNNVSRFGGYLDSITDRFSDATILLGIALYLDGYLILIFIVLVGSLLVSYARTRAEIFIDKCDVGIAERAERLIILIIATLFEIVEVLSEGTAFIIALIILGFLTYITVIQRVLYTRAKLDN